MQRKCVIFVASSARLSVTQDSHLCVYVSYTRIPVTSLTCYSTIKISLLKNVDAFPLFTLFHHQQQRNKEIMNGLARTASHPQPPTIQPRELNRMGWNLKNLAANLAVNDPTGIHDVG